MDYVDSYKDKTANYLNNLFQIWDNLSSDHEHYHIIDKEINNSIELLIKLIKKEKQ